MESIRSVLNFLTTNKEVLGGVLLSVIAVIKLTSWGRSKASALDAVIGVIERLGAGNVKQAVAAQEKSLASGALDALKTSVAKADPKQTVPGPVTRTLQEVFRGILPKK